MTQDESDKRIGILERKVDREHRARVEAEKLLESKAAELQKANEILALEVQKARSLTAAIEGATDGIALTNSQGNYTFMNGSHAQMFGYEIDELIGRPWSTLYGPTETVRIGNSVMPALFQNGYWRGEATGKTKDGTPLVQELALTALPDGGLVCATRDITQRRKGLMRAREMEMALQKAERDAALYTLGTAVAHDFNNLIAAISGYAVLIQSDLPATTKAHIRATRIEKAASQASAIVRSLEIERMDDARSFESFDLVAMITTGLSIAEAIRPPNVHFEIDLPQTANIVSNELTLSRCLFNIVKNAFEAMNGDGTLKIRLSKTPTGLLADDCARISLGAPASEYAWVIELSDTGKGIAEDKLDKIFDPFFSTKPKFQGSGLGLLSLVNLVELEAAFIEVMSKGGTGTLFRISLHKPRHFARVQHDTANLARQQKSLTKPLILIVEDEHMMADILTSNIESFGYASLWIEDPRIALNSISQSEFRVDVVITDLSMPNLSGAELTQKVKKMRPDVPIILYSGRAGFIAPDPAYFAILRKPISTDHLRRVIADALDFAGSTKANRNDL
jgi:two-component system cell cycle sensor histidine kinase/response regulator CckA